MPPAPLRADLIVRFPPLRCEPPIAVPVRSAPLGADLRFFLLAWAFGFIAFLVLIA